MGDTELLDLKIENLRESQARNEVALAELLQENKKDHKEINETLTAIQVELASQKMSVKNTAGAIAVVISVFMSAVGWFVGHLQKG